MTSTAPVALVQTEVLAVSEPEIGEQVLELRCEAGNVQELRLRGYTREGTESLAGLMDGTSPMYKFPPRESEGDGVIGRCSWPVPDGRCSWPVQGWLHRRGTATKPCGRFFKATVR